jgi:hypothetical protein
MAQRTGPEYDADREDFLVRLLEIEDREEQAAIDRELDRRDREREVRINRVEDGRFRRLHREAYGQ